MDKHQEIFNKYMSLMSDEMRENIVGYEKLSKEVALPSYAVRDGAVKIVFKNGEWLRVYQVTSGGIEWY